ncbi:MAG: hypothetical protein FWF57_00375 [Defluviitaleaceae bacterium]|nr:hypothetical protein [Defluviitaleaceae bacterium]
MLAGGIAGTPSYIGFGINAPGVTVFGSNISLVGTTGLANFAFTMPRSGTITSLSADFTVVAGTSIGIGSTFVNAQVYIAPAGSTTFTPQSSVLELSPGVGLISIGQLLSGSIALNIPVNTGDQVLLVFGANSNGGITVLAGSINGYASAGIAIS